MRNKGVGKIASGLLPVTLESSKNAARCESLLLLCLFLGVGCGPAQIESSSVEELQSSVASIEEDLEPMAIEGFREDVELVLQNGNYAALDGLTAGEVYLKAVDIRREGAKRASEECIRNCENGILKSKQKVLSANIAEIEMSLGDLEKGMRDRGSILGQAADDQDVDNQLLMRLKATRNPAVDQYQALKERVVLRKESVLQLRDIRRSLRGGVPQEDYLIDKAFEQCSLLRGEIEKVKDSLVDYLDRDLVAMPLLREAQDLLQKEQSSVDERSAAIDSLKTRLVIFNSENIQSVEARRLLIDAIDKFLPDLTVSKMFAKEVGDLLASSPYLLIDHKGKLEEITQQAQALNADIEIASVRSSELKDYWVDDKVLQREDFEDLDVPFMIGSSLYQFHMVEGISGANAEEIFSLLLDDVDEIERVGCGVVSLSFVGELSCKLDVLNLALAADDDSIKAITQDLNNAIVALNSCKTGISQVLAEASDRKAKLEHFLSIDGFESVEMVRSLVVDYEDLIGKFNQELLGLGESRKYWSDTTNDILSVKNYFQDVLKPLWAETRRNADFAVIKSVAHQVKGIIEGKVDKQVDEADKLLWSVSLTEFLFKLSPNNYFTVDIHDAPVKVVELLDREGLKTGYDLVAATVKVDWDWGNWKKDLYDPLEAIVANQSVGHKDLSKDAEGEYRFSEYPGEYIEAGYSPIFFISPGRSKAYFCHPDYVSEFNRLRNIWVVNSAYQCYLIHEISGQGSYYATPQFRSRPHLKLPVASVGVRDTVPLRTKYYDSSVVLSDSVTRTEFLSDSIQIDLGDARRSISYRSSDFSPEGSQGLIPYRYYCPQGFDFNAPRVIFHYEAALLLAGGRTRSLRVLQDGMDLMLGVMNPFLDHEWETSYNLHPFGEDD